MEMNGKSRVSRTGWLVGTVGLALTIALLTIAGTQSRAGIAEETASEERKWDRNKGSDLTFIQIGDLHGHLIPRPHLRSDGRAQEQGGLARMSTKIKEIRKQDKDAMLFNAGDTIQGGAEALYTRGQAMVDVLDTFGIDGYASGNWDFLYGTERYLDLFGDGRWGAVAANLYYDGAPYEAKTGQRVLPPYRVKTVNGVKVGILGFTSERGPTVGGGAGTKGFRFTGEGEEMPEFIDILRNKEKVDVVVMLSELGLAKNVQLAERYPGVDVLISQDMHEETPRAIMTSNGTLVSEAGQDGTQLAEVQLQINKGKPYGYRYTFHTIDGSIAPDPEVARKIEDIREEFVAGEEFEPHANPINGTTLKTPIDKVVGKADVPLYRGNFSHEHTPGVIEGSSHNFLADAFKDQTGADVGLIRGFRYGTHVAPGDIKLEDLYHYIPVGPMIARGTVTGKQLKDQVEASIDGSLNPNVFAWTGGWVLAYSGIKYDLDPYTSKGKRAQNIMVWNGKGKKWEPLNPTASYSVGGYWYANQPKDVGGLKVAESAAAPLTDPDGSKLDGTEVVVNYLKNNSANPQLNRINLLAPLPEPVYGNREVQPLKGVPTTH